MPLDPSTVQVVMVDEASGEGRAIKAYPSHFSTCPHANEHRSPRAGAEKLETVRVDPNMGLGRGMRQDKAPGLYDPDGR